MWCIWGQRGQKQFLHSTCISHLLHCPCCHCRRSPWQHCSLALSSQCGTHSARCSDPWCIAHSHCTAPDSHLQKRRERLINCVINLNLGWFSLVPIGNVTRHLKLITIMTTCMPQTTKKTCQTNSWWTSIINQPKQNHYGFWLTATFWLVNSALTSVVCIESISYNCLKTMMWKQWWRGRAVLISIKTSILTHATKAASISIPLPAGLQSSKSHLIFL